MTTWETSAFTNEMTLAIFVLNILSSFSCIQDVFPSLGNRGKVVQERNCRKFILNVIKINGEAVK